MLVKSKLTKVQRQVSQIKLTFTIPLDESEHDFETLDGMTGFLMFQGKPIIKRLRSQLKTNILVLILQEKHGVRN